MLVIPDDSLFRAALIQQISQLAKTYHWEEVGVLTPEEIAQATLEMLVKFARWEGNLIGSIVGYVGGEPPSGTLKCDGTVYPRTAFPELHEALSGSLYQITADLFVTPILEVSGTDPIFSLFDWAIVSGRQYETSQFFLPANVWGDGTPSYGETLTDAPYWVGHRFKTDVAGYVISIRIYHITDPTALDHASLFTNTGTLIKAANFAAQPAGWVKAIFDQPQLIAANTNYIAAVKLPHATVALTDNYFTAAHTVGHITFPADAASPNFNGCYSDSSSATYPNLNATKANFYIDVEFVPSD